MKHVIFPVILVVSLPVFAADQPPAAAPDSPLVAAAKRANRLGKKPSLVITNDDLVRTNGHGFTETSAQQPVTAPKGTAAPTPEMAAAAAAAKAAQHRAELAAVEKQRQDVKHEKASQRQDLYENDDFLNADPARHERAMDSLAQPTQPQSPSQPQASSNTSQPQQTNTDQKPPQN